MTNTRPTPRLDQAINGYIATVHREVLRCVALVRHGFDADDIAQEIALEVARRPEVIMARYPDPLVYARRRTKHAGISFDRRERAQRSEGVRLRRGTDGLLTPGRPYVSGNATGPEGGDELFATARDVQAEFDSATVDFLDALESLRRCCVGVSHTDLHELLLVDGCGYSVLEVARMKGQARETVSRRLNATRRRIRQSRAAMPNEQESPS